METINLSKIKKKGSIMFNMTKFTDLGRAFAGCALLKCLDLSM